MINVFTSNSGIVYEGSKHNFVLHSQEAFSCKINVMQPNVLGNFYLKSRSGIYRILGVKGGALRSYDEERCLTDEILEDMVNRLVYRDAFRFLHGDGRRGIK